MTVFRILPAILISILIISCWAIKDYSIDHRNNTPSIKISNNIKTVSETYGKKVFFIFNKNSEIFLDKEFISYLSNTLKAKGLMYCENINDADIIINVNFLTNILISKSTSDNIKRYWAYNDISSGMKINQNGDLAEEDDSFVISDTGIVFGNSSKGLEGIKPQLDEKSSTNSAFALDSDIITGSAIGGLFGYAIASSNPATVALLGLTGGITGYGFQKYSEKKFYFISGNFNLKEKVQNSFEKKMKSKYKSGDSQTGEFYFSYNSNYITSESKFYIISPIQNQRRQEIIETENNKNLLNLIINTII